VGGPISRNTVKNYVLRARIYKKARLIKKNG
jgi:hypothetical protein